MCGSHCWTGLAHRRPSRRAPLRLLLEGWGWRLHLRTSDHWVHRSQGGRRKGSGALHCQLLPCFTSPELGRCPGSWHPRPSSAKRETEASRVSGHSKLQRSRESLACRVQLGHPSLWPPTLDTRWLFVKVVNTSQRELPAPPLPPVHQALPRLRLVHLSFGQHRAQGPSSIQSSPFPAHGMTATLSLNSSLAPFSTHAPP